MKASDLVTIWSAPDNSRLTAKQYSFRLPVHVAAKLARWKSCTRQNPARNWSATYWQRLSPR